VLLSGGLLLSSLFANSDNKSNYVAIGGYHLSLNGHIDQKNRYYHFKSKQTIPVLKIDLQLLDKFTINNFISYFNSNKVDGYILDKKHNVKYPLKELDENINIFDVDTNIRYNIFKNYSNISSSNFIGFWFFQSWDYLI